MTGDLPERPTTRGQRPDRGFTLIEILVAIVLVGVLGAVAVVGVGSLTDRGSEAGCTASLDATRSASDAYYAIHAAFPTSLSQLTSAAPPLLVLNDAVTVNPAGTRATGPGWTMSFAPGAGSTAPALSCTRSGRDAPLAVTGGLAAWYDAADSATISSSGSTVTRWADKSGNGNDASAALGTVTRATTQNGLPVMHFDGSATLLAPHSASLDLSGSGLTLVVVYRATALAGAMVNKESTYEIGQLGGVTAAVKAPCWTWTGNVAAPFGTWHTVTFRYTPGWKFTVDDGPVVDAGTPCSGSIVPSTHGLTIGGRANGATASLTGDIAEVLVYGRALADDELGSGTYPTRGEVGDRLRRPHTIIPEGTPDQSVPGRRLASCSGSPR